MGSVDIAFVSRLATVGAVAMATAFTLSGPSSGAFNTASTNFTVGANGPLSSSTVFTPTSSAGTGVFVPTTVTIDSGTPTGTFTYRGTSSGLRQISGTGALSSPANVAYTVQVGISVTLTDANNAVLPNRTGLKWAWWDSPTVSSQVAPTDNGTGATTGAAGIFSVTSLPNSALAPADTGWIEITDSDGTVAQSPIGKVAAGPVVVQ